MVSTYPQYTIHNQIYALLNFTVKDIPRLLRMWCFCVELYNNITTMEHGIGVIEIDHDLRKHLELD